MKFRTFLICLFVLKLCECQLLPVFRQLRRLFNINGGVIEDTTTFRKQYDFIVIGAGRCYLLIQK